MKNAVEKALWDTNESHPSLSEVPTARFDNKEVQGSPRCYDGPRISLIKGIECRVREHQDYKDYTLVLNLYAAGTGESVLVLTIAPWCEERDTLAEVRIHIELEWLGFSPPLPTSLTDHHTTGGDRDSDGDDDDGDECQADEEHFINVLPSVACLEMALSIKAFSSLFCIPRNPIKH
ncbi:hypothetical protein FOCG_08809 [Fusarium oxysporum f. sp. radicis-lycopersici 26381]|nr:hypothetical protein FOCG_08809 [Fusarium oxysporum f. sp. radicis-lycopersici 26381]